MFRPASGSRSTISGAIREPPLSNKRRRIMDASLDVEYSSKSENSDQALVARQRKALHAEASEMVVNDNLKSVDVVFLPSVHRMVNNSYAVIESEVRRLLRASNLGGGLDKSQTAQFERYVSSLVRLANLERSVRDDSEVEAMSDEELTTKVIEKLSESK